MNIIELNQYPQIEDFHQPKEDTFAKVRDFLSEFGFFYIKDTISARTNIDEALENLQDSVDVYYGEDAYTGEGSVFHGTYSRFQNLGNNTVINRYLGLVSDLLSLISLAFGYEQDFLQKISQQKNYGLYFYDREDKYVKFISEADRKEIVVPPHKDRSIITLVVSIKGLEGYSPQNKWFSVPDRESYIIVQAGTLLQTVTNSAIKANIHRVRGYDSSKAVFWSDLVPVQ